MDISDLHPDSRPRARLAAKGPAALSAGELISLVTGAKDTEQALGLLAVADGLTALGRMSEDEIFALGVSPAAAARLVAAFELGKRLLADWPTGARIRVRSPGDVAERLVLQMGRLEREELRVVLLNSKNDVLRIVTVYQGNVSASLVRVSEVFTDAVRLHASGMLLVHNHPSGDPTPSPDDLHLTAECLAAGRILDIEVMDHIVIGRDAWVSLRDRGVQFDRNPVRAAE